MRFLCVLVAAVSLMFLSCSETGVTITHIDGTIELQTSGLPPLRSDEGHYGLWATFYSFPKAGPSAGPMHGEGFLLLAEFNVDAAGTPIALDGGQLEIAVPAGQSVQLIDDAIVTIEAHARRASGSLHDEPGPAIMGAKVVGTAALGVANMHVAYADAFRANFRGVSGTFSVTSPTSPPDSNSGIWFFVANPTPTASVLDLPPLPASWRYEGWVIDDSDTSGRAYYSIGRFLRADSADFDGAGPGAGALPPPNFPGQDFINAVPGQPERPNLNGAGFSFMVTVEPEPDNGPGPFFLQILNSVPPSGSWNALAPRVFYNVAHRHEPSAVLTIRR